MSSSVQVRFDCLPLRAVNRFDAPLDASREVREKCRRIAAAAEKHGRHNTYYLHAATCTFQLTNDPRIGRLEFAFEGVVLADAHDRTASGADLQVELVTETCDWLTDPVVSWFAETVQRAVMAEFDLYIAAGDLEKTNERIRQLQATMDANEAYLGMYL